MSSNQFESKITILAAVQVPGAGIKGNSFVWKTKLKDKNLCKIILAFLGVSKKNDDDLNCGSEEAQGVKK